MDKKSLISRYESWDISHSEAVGMADRVLSRRESAKKSKYINKQPDIENSFRVDCASSNLSTDWQDEYGVFLDWSGNVDKDLESPDV